MASSSVSIFSLPVEDVLVPHILCHFDCFELWRLRLVCKDLYKAVYCYYATNCLDVNVTPAIIEDNTILPIVQKILSYCWRLQKFSLNGSTFPKTQDYQIKLEKCLLILSATSSNTLRELHLEAVQLSQKAIKSLKLACINLHKLSFHSITYKKTFENNEEILDMTHVIKDCVSLEEYHSDVCSYELQAILSRQTKLKVLKLSGCNTKSTPLKFETLFLLLPSLHTLSLSYIPWVTDNSLLQAIEYCPSLRKVSIFHCPLVTWQVLDRFKCKGITMQSNILPINVQPTSFITKNQI